MTYSYQGPLTYGTQANGTYYDEAQYKKPSAVPATIAGVVIGGTTGAVIGSRKNPYIEKNGEVIDSFAKSTYEKYISNTGNGKEAYEGGLNILKKIDKVKSAEELGALFSENSEAANYICAELKQTPEEFISNINDKNLSANKKVIKEKITIGNNTRYRDMKNQIQACWDGTKKEFVKKDSVTDDVFKAIKKSTGGIKSKMIAKYAAIGAAIAGAIGFIGAKLFIK